MAGFADWLQLRLPGLQAHDYAAVAANAACGPAGAAASGGQLLTPAPSTDTVLAPARAKSHP